MADKVRPTKKQRETLMFIESFIAGHGYGPSLREIMRGMGFKSVSTAAYHVDTLIARGHLIKRDGTARSLEVVDSSKEFSSPKKVKESEEKWLVEKIEQEFEKAEASAKPTQGTVDKLYVLVGSLKILGFEGASNSFISRLAKLKKRV